MWGGIGVSRPDEESLSLCPVTDTCNRGSIRGWYREGHSAMIRAWLELCQCRCLPCGFEFRLVQDFQKNIMFLLSQYWDIVSMLCPWTRHFTLKCYTWLRWKRVGLPGRTEMAMYMISSMRRNGCRTVCSPWSSDGTWMNSSSDQGVKIEKSNEILYQIKNLQLYLWWETIVY